MIIPVIGQQALGFGVGGSTDRKFFRHGGANEAYRCMLVAYHDGEGAIVMTNSDNGDPLVNDIIRTVAAHYTWPDFAPAKRVLTKIDPTSFDKFQGVSIR